MRGNDLEAFKTLHTIIHEGSFRKAAAILHKTVPAISYSISQLESRYGFTLLDRSGYRVKLTDHGSRLLDEAKKVISQAEYLDSVAAQLESGWEPSLNVVIDGMLDPGVILAAINTLKQERSPTHFRLKTEYLAGVEKRFEQDNADVMFSLVRANNDKVHCEHLFDIDIVLVGAPHLPICKKDKVTMDELSTCLEVSVQDSSAREPQAGRSLNGPELFFVGDFYTKKQAILKGMGFGWMPVTWVEEELMNRNLVQIPFEGGSRDVYQVTVGTWRNRSSGNAQKKFIELIRANFSKPPARNNAPTYTRVEATRSHLGASKASPLISEAACFK